MAFRRSLTVSFRHGGVNPITCDGDSALIDVTHCWYGVGEGEPARLTPMRTAARTATDARRKTSGPLRLLRRRGRGCAVMSCWTRLSLLRMTGLGTYPGAGGMREV